ncbi:MAG TPA: hypothetical protein VLN73_03270, partial [Alphaproteobacteria bacterium]|nr:hypothetical protein [Alphaproteobacteria bacterium]
MSPRSKNKPRLALPRRVGRRAAVKISRDVLGKRRRQITREEDILRIQSLGLDWDIGVMVYAPRGRVTRGADGKKAGFFLLHGGNGDFKSVEPLALLLAERFGYKVVSMTFPGRLYLP